MLTDERFTMSLVGGRKSVSEAMNEVLWEDTPAQNGVGRWASRDTMLGNRRIKAGDMVCLGLAAVNTDPQMRPDGSKLTGGNNAFLSFGHGEHRCPVAAQEIAETIARTAIEVLLDRLPDIDFVIPAEELTRRPSPWARGMTTLPVHFTPTPAVNQMAGWPHPHPPTVQRRAYAPSPVTDGAPVRFRDLALAPPGASLPGGRAGTPGRPSGRGR
ncbi:hypothetical protein SHXM_09908 [Streptomyces hygroscopicus]|nr:hypothetical protein SHXM_09908 [Streptomyces hygroscopicus]